MRKPLDQPLTSWPTRQVKEKNNFYWWDWSFTAGEVRSTDSLESYTVAGYDLFIYVYDGTTLVGPKTLTVIVTGTFIKISWINLNIAWINVLHLGRA